MRLSKSQPFFYVTRNSIQREKSHKNIGDNNGGSYRRAGSDRRRNDEEYGSLCSIRAKAQWQDRDESRRMRKLRRETSIISITDLPRNGKFPGIYGDRDEDTELFCIFL